MFDGIRHTDYRDERPYHQPQTGSNYALLEVQRVTLCQAPLQTVSFTLGTINPYRPCVEGAATWQGAVLLQGLEDIGCGGKSVLQAITWGYLPVTDRFKGPFVA